MSNKKRILVIMTILLLVISISASVIGILNSEKEVKDDNKKEEIPKITEDFKEVELVSKYISENYISYDEDDDEILEYIDFDYYIIGRNGKLTNDKVIKEYNESTNTFLTESKNYKFYTNEENYAYYINTKNNKKSKTYDDILLPKKGELTGIYAILITYKENDQRTYEVLNTNNGSITKLNINDLYIESYSSILNEDMKDINADSINYFKVSNNTNKYGLIDHNGNIIIDIIYDDITIFNDKYIIASNNNKYGIVNLKNEEIIPFEYDKITYIENYIILYKNNKISIANSNIKIYIDSKIDYSFDNRNILDNLETPFTSKTYNNKLYLVVYYNNKLSIYLINNKDIERKISTTTDFIDLKSIKDSYIYTVENSNNERIITFYDYDLYEYYKLNIKTNNNIKYNYEITSLNNNYYMIRLYNEELPELDEYYYIDLFNSKQIDEYTALKKYFKNGYNFYISNDNKLKVYKNNELLNEFEGNYKYLSGYLFLKDNEIFELTFKKDSTNK